MTLTFQAHDICELTFWAIGLGSISVITWQNIAVKEFDGVIHLD